MGNPKRRDEEAQEWADTDMMGIEGGQARWQEARTLGRSKDQ